MKKLIIDLKKGDKIWFETNKRPFTVREANNRFAICTQPYNFKPRTVVYTIIDFERNVRGLDNLVFGLYDYYSDKDCKRALKSLISGEMEVSYRRGKYVELDISIIKFEDYKKNGKKTNP